MSISFHFRAISLNNLQPHHIPSHITTQFAELALPLRYFHNVIKIVCPPR